MQTLFRIHDFHAHAQQWSMPLYKLWFYQQHVSGNKKGRAMKTGRAWVLLCGVLALILVGASLGIRIMHIIMQGTSASAAHHQKPQESR